MRKLGSTALLTILSMLTMLSLASAESYEKKTFPVGTSAIPMDNHQASILEAFGLAHALLREGITIFRIIEPPDVTMKTTAFPAGDVYAGGPILITEPIPAAITATFPTVTIDSLIDSVTSDRVFRVGKATNILVVYGFWGLTNFILDWMRIPYALVLPENVEADPSMLENYNLIVVDCKGWAGTLPYAVKTALESFADRGGELIFTDIALLDLDAVFPGYVSVVLNSDGKWNFNAHNVGEFPSQYYGLPSIPIYTMGKGYLVDQVLDPSVRVTLDSNNYGYEASYRVGAFYFPYGDGIVEGFAYHPAEQDGGDARILSASLYGNKFIHVLPPPLPKLEVTADAHTSLRRTYHWSMDMSADQITKTLAIKQSFPVNYSVLTDVTGLTDSEFVVSGNISVHNPASVNATINSISNVVSGVGSATVRCGVSFPHTLANGETLNCTYSTGLPDTSTRTNTVTVTLQNPDDGTTDFSGSAVVEFSSASIMEADKCINANDTFAGSLGTICYPEVPKTMCYSRAIGPYNTCGIYTVSNTASIETNDTHITGSDSWTVSINVPCNSCTFTIGYWKTHAGFGPQPDKVTPLLPINLGAVGGAKTVNVTTARQAVTILHIRCASNGINKLYAQLLGAKLNIKNGADSSAISGTIAAADAFLATKNAANWNCLTKQKKNQVLIWVKTLDNYNNGLIGPGHCRSFFPIQ